MTSLRNARPLTFRPRGLSDTVDSTNTFPGAMQQLMNLVPAPHTKNMFVPRPAAVQLTAFAGFNAPAQITGLLVVGTKAYGMISSAHFAGKDEPFVYDLVANTFAAITGLSSALLPSSPATSGDWTPPSLTMVGGRVLVCHPGFAGGAGAYFGWLDISNFSIATLTGNVQNGSKVIQSISGSSSAPILVGAQVGMLISGTGIPAGAYITALDNGTFDLNTTANIVGGQTTITNLGSVAGVLAGMEVSGPGIAAGTTVVSTSAFSLNTTGTVAAGSNTITAVASVAGVLPGMLVSGNNIVAGTYITNVGATTITMNNAATGAASGEAIAINGGNTMVVSGAPTGTSVGANINVSGGGTITISANATATNAGVALTVQGGTPGAPLWGAGNTNTNPLPAVPVAVSNFNGRAWFAVNNSTVFSDALQACQVSFASQALVLGANDPVTAFASLPLSTIQGGVVQALMAFKGASSVFQITGDQATANLSVNALPLQTGTVAPNSICNTPMGVAFLAPDGLRIIGFDASISSPIGAEGDGVTLPFLAAIAPSRMCMAFNKNVLRASVQNGNATGQPVQEYWFHFDSKSWSGPHSLAASLIQPYGAGGFVAAAAGINAKLWQGQPIPVPSSSYVEDGSQLAWSFETSLLPDNGGLSVNRVVRALLGMVLPANLQVTVQALDEAGIPLDAVFISASSSASTLWKAFTWGAALWGGAIGGYFRQFVLPWHQPLIFKQASIFVSGSSVAGFAIGNIYADYQPLGYASAA